MYKYLIKPLLFALNIEQAHQAAVLLLRVIGAIPGGRTLLKAIYKVDNGNSLEREVLGLKFKNPIGMAAGFDNNADIIGELGAIGFGFVEVGTITETAQSGNPRPRVFRLNKDKAIVTRIGATNRGWRSAINHLRREHKGVVVGCNIGCIYEGRDEQIRLSYLPTFRNLYQYVDYFTVNITNDFTATDEQSHAPQRIYDIIGALFDFRRGQSEYRPILLKISPDIDDKMLDSIVDILINTPLDGIVAVSGTHSRSGLKTSGASIAKIGEGRLCGEPLRERALHVVREIHRRTEGNYPIIGVGGISTAEHAQQMLDAGASLVQIYSSLIYEGPSVVKDICEGLIEQNNPKKEA